MSTPPSNCTRHTALHPTSTFVCNLLFPLHKPLAGRAGVSFPNPTQCSCRSGLMQRRNMLPLQYVFVCIEGFRVEFRAKFRVFMIFLTAKHSVSGFAVPQRDLLEPTPTQSPTAQVREDYKPFITDKVAKAQTEARLCSMQQDNAHHD